GLVPTHREALPHFDRGAAVVGAQNHDRHHTLRDAPGSASPAGETPCELRQADAETVATREAAPAPAGPGARPAPPASLFAGPLTGTPPPVPPAPARSRTG